MGWGWGVLDGATPKREVSSLCSNMGHPESGYGSREQKLGSPLALKPNSLPAG